MNKKIYKILITTALLGGVLSDSFLNVSESVNATTSAHASSHSTSHASSHFSARSSSRSSSVSRSAKSSVISRSNSIKSSSKSSVTSREASSNKTSKSSVLSRSSIKSSNSFKGSTFNSKFGETTSVSRSLYSSGFGGSTNSSLGYLYNPYTASFRNYYIADNLFNSNQKDSKVLKDAVVKNKQKTYWIVVNEKGNDKSIVVTESQYKAIKNNDKISLKNGILYINGKELKK